MAHKDGMKPYKHQLVKGADVVCYKDGGRVYAIDKFGEVISSGVETTDDEVVVQAGIDSLPGSPAEGVIVLLGSFTWTGDPPDWEDCTVISKDGISIIGSLDVDNLKVDTVTEHTTDAGVTVEGILIKDSAVDTNVAAAGVTLSGTTLAADGTDENIDIDITPKGTGEVNISKVDIDAGTIDGATIATSDVTVGAGKTLDVSAGTFTLADDQVSGDKVEGGTINSTTINTLGSTTITATTVNATTLDTNVDAAGVTLSGTTLQADGTDDDISIALVPKGDGFVKGTLGAYDAMVFIKGSTVYAVDKENNIIAYGTAGTDDTTVIQAAINALSSGESLVINQGDYVISSTIIINKKNVNISGLGTESTILTADSDITVVRVLNSSYSCLEKMCLSASSAQTSPVLELNASDGPIHFSRFIRLKILNTHINYNANAIDIVGSGTGSVMCCTFDDIQLYKGWNHGILFNFNDTSWATASVFNNIVIWHPDAGIRFDGGTRHVTGGSVYSNIIIEGHPSHTTSGGFVDIGGEGNTFIGNFCYDWGVGYGPMYSFTSTSRGNNLISPQFNSTSYPSDGIIDEGNYNVILGTPFQNVASRDIRVVGPYQRYTTISEALSSISGNSSSRRFVIYVIGNVTENLTSNIVLKSYVDIIGIGNPKVTLNGDNGYCFYCYDDIDVLIDNLHLIRSGTGDSDTGAIYIYKGGSNGTLTIRNCKIEANCSVYSDGIRINGAYGNVLIEGCDISSTGGGTSCGIRITYTKDTSNIRIRNSEIYGAYRGILADVSCYVNVLDIYGCNITGGNNSCTVGYNVPITITGCKFFPGTLSGSTISVTRGVVKDSTIYVEGNNSTTSTSCAVLSDGNGDAKFINCDIIPMRYNSHTTWDHDGGFSVLPVSGSPYCFVHCRIYVWTAGGTIRVGTAAGLDDIASVSAATPGNKYIIIEKTAFAADTPFYTSSTDPACSYDIYYYYMLDWPRVPVRIESNSPVLEFIDCYISAPYSSDAVWYNFPSSEGKIINSVIEQPNPDQLAINTHASITCPDIYGTYINGKISSTITSFPPNANNYGIGSITPALLRPDITSFLETVGTPKLLCPCSEITGTSIMDYTRLSNTLTAQASVATWYGYQGRATYYDFDGSAHYLYRANDTDFDFGNAATDSAFSIVCCVNPDDATSRQIIGKWDDNNQREWRLFFDANDYPTFQLYDESADTWIGRQDQTAFTTGSWKILVATYDGSGINAGCKIYIDGVQLDDADYDNGVYVAMEAVTANLMVGALKNAAAYSEYYDGKMTWVGIAAKELSPDEVWSLTQRLKGVLGI